MQTICIIGANSFLGKHLLNTLSIEGMTIKALSRKPQRNIHENIIQFQGDLLNRESLDVFIDEGSIVVNLAYLWNASLEDNLLAMRNLAEVCAYKKINRLIHCSTVMVFGDAASDTVNENSPCFPKSTYELTKFQIEQLLLQYHPHFEIAILRPSAVFGPEGKNLLKLINDLNTGNQFINYLKSCLYGKRNMNLVCIDNVIAAFQFLIHLQKIDSPATFIISDDDDQSNNYHEIENQLLTLLFQKKHRIPRIALPPFFLLLISTLLRKKNVLPNRIYQSNNLETLGFKKAISLTDGINKFAEWYKS